MIGDWETNAVYVADTLAHRHPTLLQELTRILGEFIIPLVTVSGTADIWIRDAAPVQVVAEEFVQFVYRPDYLRDGYQHLITPPEAFRPLPFIRSVKRSELVIDGGNVVGTAKAVILTDKVFQENPDRSRDEIEVELRRLLRVKQVIFIPKEPYDQIGHSDGMVRFLDESTVIANDYSTVDPEFGHRLRASLERHGLTVEMLPYRPERKRIDGIDSAAGNYVNFLRVGNLILIPSYGTPQDAKAFNTLKRLCPRTTVVAVPSLDLAREGGVLQCVTWTVQTK